MYEIRALSSAAMRLPIPNFWTRIADARRQLLAVNAIKICHPATFLFMATAHDFLNS
jgi:hypothetical protein